MANATIQSSFAAGELTQALNARVDLDKFEVGAALIRNFVVDYRGGVFKRPGTEYIAAAKTAGATVRLVPFIVSSETSYVLEFGDLYIRFISNGVQLEASPGVPYEVVTPYLAADLFRLKFTQSADVLTIVHPTYPPANLSRTSETTFAYALIALGSQVLPPDLTALTAPTSGAFSYGYTITSVSLDGNEESRPSDLGVKHSAIQNETTNIVVGLTWEDQVGSDPVGRYNIYKWGPQSFADFQPASTWGYIGSSLSKSFVDTNIAQNFGQQPPVVGDPISGGQITSVTVTAGGSGYVGTADWPALPYVPLTITGDGSGAFGWALIDPVAGEIGSAYITYPGQNYTTATATAIGEGGTGATFSFTFSDPEPLYPQCVSYLQQRRIYAGAAAIPASFSLSQIGKFDNFDTTPNSLPTDAIAGVVSAQEVQDIRSLVPVSYGVLAFSSGGVFLINGGSPGAAVTPESISVTQQSSPGANYLQPLLINYDIIFGQEKGNRLRNASFAWEKQSYTVGDITQLAPHLFDSYTTVDWAWSEEPFKTVWVVRDDGRLLSCTYVPEQQVYAWARHDTQGVVGSVCSVPEGEQNAVYIAVQRFIPEHVVGETLIPACWETYIERLHPSLTCCLFDAWFLDSALSLPTTEGNTSLYITLGVGDAVTVSTESPCDGGGGGGGGGGEAAYLIDAEDNFNAADSADIAAATFLFLQRTTNIQLSTAFDPTRNIFAYSQCDVPVETPDPATTPGAWTGFTTFAPLATYNNSLYNNFSILTKNTSTGLVTKYAALDPASLVPVGIGGSDGTYVRFVTADAVSSQGIKIIEPWGGNVWSHHTAAAPRACQIYEFRLLEDYAMTISPWAPDSNVHAEMFGISEDWVLVGAFAELTANRYNLNWLPRERQADEVTADFLLEYAEIELPASFDGAANAPIRSCVDLDGQFWFAGAERAAGARDYRLVLVTPPTSGVVNPATGETATDITPWGAGTGPNTDAAAYTTASTASSNNGQILRNQISIYCVHSLNRLVYINRLYPAMKSPVSTDPLDLKFQATFISRVTPATFDFVGSFITGYMTATWVMTTVAADAAYAVYDMQEMDLYRDFVGYDYTAAGVDDTLRWFAVTVRPVTGGVIGAASTNRLVFAQYDFSGSAPTLAQFIDEASTWDANPDHAAYATTIGNTNIIYATTIGNTAQSVMLLADTGISLTSSFWMSGLDRSAANIFIDFEAYYSNRDDAPAFDPNGPFMELTFGDAPPPPPVSNGDVIQVGCVKIQVDEVLSATEFEGTLLTEIDEWELPDDPDGIIMPIPAGAWTFTTPTATVTGLDHLEAKEVYALADGTVLGPFTVSGGTVALGATYSTVVVGLRYTSELKTLYLTAEGLNQGTEQGKRKKLSGITWRTDCAMNLEHSIDGAVYNRVPETYVTSPFTGDARANTYNNWTKYGVMWARAADPLPCGVLGVIAEVTPGDTGQ